MTFFNFSLADRVTIVTGASRGIGKAIALAFADAGADVVVASRTVADLENTAVEIQSKGRRALIVQTDTSKKQDIDNMVAETIKEFGTIDILVNNAGREIVMPLMKLREDGWDKTFDVNVKGYYLCAQAAGRVMIEHKKGNIINIASFMGTLVNPNSGCYGVSKAAVLHLTRVLAGELAHHNIRVNCIVPGLIETRITEGLWSNPEHLKRWEDIIPVGRLGDPDEIAAVAVFLASDVSSYLVGSTIYADGGLALSGRNPDEWGRMAPPQSQLL